MNYYRKYMNVYDNIPNYYDKIILLMEKQA